MADSLPLATDRSTHPDSYIYLVDNPALNEPPQVYWHWCKVCGHRGPCTQKIKKINGAFYEDFNLCWADASTEQCRVHGLTMEDDARIRAAIATLAEYDLDPEALKADIALARAKREYDNRAD